MDEDVSRLILISDILLPMFIRILFSLFTSYGGCISDACTPKPPEIAYLILLAELSLVT